MVVMSYMASCPAMLRQFLICVTVTVICFVLTYLFIPTRNDSPLESGREVMRLTVIEAESRTCAPAEKSTNYIDMERQICRPLLNRDNMPFGTPVHRLPRASSMTADDYIRLAITDCDCFRSRLGYFTAADTSAEERAFPIAFSLLTYENLEQTAVSYTHLTLPTIYSV